MKEYTENLYVLVVTDEDGTMRPMAGIWIDNEAGKINSDHWLSKDDGTSTIIRARLTKNLDE